jgi:hypothetical protein
MKCDYQICIKFQIDLSHTTKEIKDDSGDKSTRLTSSRLQVQTPGPHTHTKYLYNIVCEYLYNIDVKQNRFGYVLKLFMTKDTMGRI